LDTPQKYADAILRLAQLSSEEIASMRDRIKTVAHKFDYAVLSAQFETVVANLMS